MTDDAYSWSTRRDRGQLVLDVIEMIREVNNGALLGALSLVSTETLAEMAAVLEHPAAGHRRPDPAKSCPSPPIPLRP